MIIQKHFSVDSGAAPTRRLTRRDAVAHEHPTPPKSPADVRHRRGQGASWRFRGADRALLLRDRHDTTGETPVQSRNENRLDIMSTHPPHHFQKWCIAPPRRPSIATKSGLRPGDPPLATRSRIVISFVVVVLITNWTGNVGSYMLTTPTGAARRTRGHAQPPIARGAEQVALRLCGLPIDRLGSAKLLQLLENATDELLQLALFY
ncbi:hypothetical protein PsYK624_052010 [Phanerochaete sordida]|uniref:Uncharacterized protein n=1 Tax=Phanerochaete sordida TaxID=48140 RepID=A0A9P3LC20_9APHY|nr:hypothetical protein PsYK624_052010 [Phanerochaete sordida]